MNSSVILSEKVMTFWHKVKGVMRQQGNSVFGWWPWEIITWIERAACRGFSEKIIKIPNLCLIHPQPPVCGPEVSSRGNQHLRESQHRLQARTRTGGTTTGAGRESVHRVAPLLQRETERLPIGTGRCYVRDGQRQTQSKFSFLFTLDNKSKAPKLRWPVEMNQWYPQPA